MRRRYRARPEAWRLGLRGLLGPGRARERNRRSQSRAIPDARHRSPGAPRSWNPANRLEPPRTAWSRHGPPIEDEGEPVEGVLGAVMLPSASAMPAAWLSVIAKFEGGQYTKRIEGRRTS